MQPSVESRAAIRGNPQTELVISPRPDSRRSLSPAPPPSLARSGVLHRQGRVASRAPLSPRPTGPACASAKRSSHRLTAQTAQSGYLQQSRSTRSDSPTLVLWNATSHLAGSGETAGMSPSRSRGGRCSFPLTGVTGSCPPPPLLLVRPGSVVAASRPSLPTPAFSWQASPGARSLRHERTRQRERGRTIAFAQERASLRKTAGACFATKAQVTSAASAARSAPLVARGSTSAP